MRLLLPLFLALLAISPAIGGCARTVVVSEPLPPAILPLKGAASLPQPDAEPPPVSTSEEKERAPAAPEEVAPPQPESAPGGELLTLSDLESLALQNNPTLAQAAAGIGQARGTMVQAGLYPNPQVGYLRSDPSQAGQSRTNGIFVGQEIITAGKLRKSVAAEEQEVNRAGWEMEAQQGRVLNDLRIRRFEVLGAQAAIDLAGQLAKIADQGAATTENLLAKGEATRADLLQARIQAKSVRITLNEARARQHAAWKQLLNVIGTPELPMQPLDGTLDGDLPEFDWDSTWAQIRASSPQLFAAQARIDHTRLSVVREQAQPIPNVNVQVVSQRDSALGFTSTSTLLAIPFPIYNRNQGNISHALADFREAHAEFHRTELALRDSLAEAFRRYEAARFQVQQLRGEIIPDAEENLKLTADGYQAGEVGFLQVLGARQTYFQTRLAHIEALTELRKVSVELEGLLLTGGLNPSAIGTALQAQPGMGRQRGVLNQMQESSTRQSLLPTLQTGP